MLALGVSLLHADVGFVLILCGLLVCLLACVVSF